MSEESDKEWVYRVSGDFDVRDVIVREKGKRVTIATGDLLLRMISEGASRDGALSVLRAFDGLAPGVSMAVRGGYRIERPLWEDSTIAKRILAAMNGEWLPGMAIPNPPFGIEFVVGPCSSPSGPVLLSGPLSGRLSGPRVVAADTMPALITTDPVTVLALAEVVRRRLESHRQSHRLRPLLAAALSHWALENPVEGAYGGLPKLAFAIMELLEATRPQGANQ